MLGLLQNLYSTLDKFSTSTYQDLKDSDIQYHTLFLEDDLGDIVSVEAKRYQRTNR